MLVIVFCRRSALVLFLLTATAALSSPPPGTEILDRTLGRRVVNPAASARAPKDHSTCWEYKPSERGFAQLHNARRADNGLPTLRLDPELTRAARSHTRKMVRSAKLFHTATDTLKRRIVNWVVLGENVGVGGSVQSLTDAFMASPAHKANILYSTFRHVGVGVKQMDGRMWVTVIFQANEDPGTRLWMRKC
ncbi:MAG: CAP domain-containing protein [Actinomycetota bacterium]